ncbi:serine/threonine-protein kinase [Streptomyces netropsis]|uniref:serine/threonine-protein kinase n=1 Tax=Streptomyces netropsis TaxID=55404 RepID=UPI0030D092E8
MTAGEANGDELIGKVLGGRYRVTAMIGRGGMGVVARAVDELLNREVAVKVLRAFTDASAPELADLRTRMQREAQAAARIRHGGVVTVHDVTEEQGLPVIVMELVDGPSLDDVLVERGTLEPHEAAAIGAELMAALDAAHRVGVLHRDVKPGNVLLEHGERSEMGVPPAGGWGRVVLTDFGIATMEASGDEAMAKLTQSGQLVGSIDYLPPERAQGREPGPASDIWSLGMTLYAAVEGTAPFRRTSVWSTLSAIVTEPLPEPQRAGALAPVLRALMAKEPENRPTADQAREMLERVAAGGTASLAPPAPVPTPTQAVTPTPPPGFGAAPPFHQATPQAPHVPQAPYTGYPPPGSPPHPVPQAGAPVAGHAPGAGRSADGRGRRRSRTLVAAAAAAVVLAGGGVTYALVGNGDDAQAAAPGAGSPAGSGRPSGSGPTGANPPSASPPKGPHGKPSGAASHASASPKAKPTPTAKPGAPAAKPSAVSKSCSGWSHRDAKPGSYGYLSGDFHVVTGPYQTCSSVTRAKSGTKLRYQCYVTNAYGNKWIYVRVDGASTSGWMSADNLTRQSGQPVRC